jgi:Mn2+/Fe2+ NRAMP family transporter
MGLTLTVVSGSYLRWERIALCLADLTWFALAWRVDPDWASVAPYTIAPTTPAGGINGSLVSLVIAIVGTTIAPTQLPSALECRGRHLRAAEQRG